MDSTVLPPDQSATEHELLEYLQRSAAKWPRSERTMFELHFLEGFELDEVAMLQGWDLKQAAALRDAVHHHLRHLLREATETVSHPRLPIMSGLMPSPQSRRSSGKTSFRS
jgi:DNA-directed RNA polymerase specialized sigma24 family protein